MLSPLDWKKIRISLYGAQTPAGANEVIDGLCDGYLKVVRVGKCVLCGAETQFFDAADTPYCVKHLPSVDVLILP